MAGRLEDVVQLEPSCQKVLLRRKGYLIGKGSVTFHIILHVVTYYLILSLLDVTVQICQVEILLSTCIIE